MTWLWTGNIVDNTEWADKTRPRDQTQFIKYIGESFVQLKIFLNHCFK